MSLAPPPRPELTTIEPRSSATLLMPPGSVPHAVESEHGVGTEVDVARLELAVAHGRVDR